MSATRIYNVHGLAYLEIASQKPLEDAFHVAPGSCRLSGPSDMG